ncbi:hypothetical protein [Demequina soli]|uniref:hypothetical protein n=1 Tax=Demequina soli TaxID=1638987 RepID=UPI000780C0DA|nr:hypothetical protein [Demequina soli]
MPEPIASPPALRWAGSLALMALGALMGAIATAVAGDGELDATALVAIVGDRGPVATAIAAGLAAWGVVHTSAQRAREAREEQVRREIEHWWANARWAVELDAQRKWRAAREARIYLIATATTAEQRAFVDGAIASELARVGPVPDGSRGA